MKKIGTVTTERIQIFKEKQLAIGLDLGDRTSHNCVLNEAGEVIKEIESLNERVAEYDRRIEHIATEVYPQVAVLKQIKGVGPLIALTFVLTLDDPNRFRHSRDVGCFVGLRPGRRKVAAPTELSAPTLQRATIAHQRLRMEGWRLRRLGSKTKNPRK